MAFLFTDGERSTRLWQLDAEETATALSRRDEILRGDIEDHGGDLPQAGVWS